MTDEEVAKIIAKLTKVVATKEDLKSFATKEDLKSFATKEDLKSFATKEDLGKLVTKEDLKKSESKLVDKIGEVDQSVHAVLKYADAINETTADYEKRLQKIEKLLPISH